MDKNKNRKTIGIVGGGISGVVSAKSALECNLSPTIFERNDQIGGIWNVNKEGYIWDSMKTNLSYYTCMFSDYPWRTPPASPDLFPTGKEVQEYVIDYATHFDVYPHRILFNSNVTRVYQNPQTEMWTIEWTATTTPTTTTTTNNFNNKSKVDNNNFVKMAEMTLKKKEFDFVIIASGFFSTSVIPSNIDNLQSIFGNEHLSFVRHYKRPDESLRDKRVVMVGGSYSGSEIAVDLSSTVKDIIMVARHKPWYFKRSFAKIQGGPIHPIDVNFFTRYGDRALRPLSISEQNRTKNTKFSVMCQQQQTIPSIRVDSDPTDPPFGSISDRFVSLVESGKIIVKHSEIDFAFTTAEEDEEIKGEDGGSALISKSIKFKDGSVVNNIDHVFISTGYKLLLPFFDQDMLDSLEYQGEDSFQPVLLHKCVFCPNKRGIAFVGIMKGPFFSSSELQARWATMVFSGTNGLDYPTKEEVASEIEKERAIRNGRPKKQWPHSNNVEYCDDLASEIGCLPDFENIKNQDPKLYKMLWLNCVSSSSYRLVGFASDPINARKHLEEIDSKFYSHEG